MKKIIATTNAPAAIGPYSQAIDCGSFLVTSGQVPFDPATGEFVPGGIIEQTRQVLTNIKAILEAAGLTMDNVVKTTVFLQSMGDFAAMNAVYATFFPEGACPARSAVQVARLPKDGRPISQRSDLAALYAQRAPLYARFADAVIDNNGTPEETVQKILEVLA